MFAWHGTPLCLRIIRRWGGWAIPSLFLYGCALGVAADAASVGASGKSVTDHALDTATGQDCNLIQGLTRADREVCEPPGSAVTERDFKGLSGSGS